MSEKENRPTLDYLRSFINERDVEELADWTEDEYDFFMHLLEREEVSPEDARAKSIKGIEEEFSISIEEETQGKDSVEDEMLEIEKQTDENGAPTLNPLLKRLLEHAREKSI